MIISYADDQRGIEWTVRRPRMRTMTTTTHRVTFGVKTSQANTTYGDVVRIWREADQIPAFEHAWLCDHLVPLRGDVSGPALEAWTLLAALAAQTERLRLGVIVTSNRLRPPAVLAKMAATVDRISNGRLVFGIGAGGSAVRDPAGLALVHRELDAYGIPVVPTGEAIDALDEACVIAKRMWTETEPFDFDGRHYQLHGAVCEPKPMQAGGPPIMIGAGGIRSLRVVARHADIWNCPTRGDVGMVRDLGRILDDHCAAIGRDPAEIERSVQLLVAAGPSPATPAAGLPQIADAATTRDLVLELIDAGVTHVVLAPVAAATDRPVQWLADEIVGPVREVLGRQAR
jgi:alkanesulfonate monooxygenase SsuD/methylene tetrahydromethanopterin reductase-like flavin-dependent oxidoreductase (luciferase family)